MFTALDLYWYSVNGMLSDFWHTFCRRQSRCDLMMARAKTPFLFVQTVDVRRTRVKRGPRDRVGHVAPHVAVIQGYLFEGLDQWVHRPWKGRDRSGPQISIRNRKCLPIVPIRDRHGRRSGRGPVPPKDRIGLGLLDSRWSPLGRRQRDGGDHAGVRGHDRRGARRSELPLDFRHERRPTDRRYETRLAGVPLRRRPEDRHPALRSKGGPRTRRAAYGRIGDDASAGSTSILQGRSETLSRRRGRASGNLLSPQV